ncbi:hypothetical protein A6J80_16220 [Paracoccus yeei]|uniref:DUF1156 domain-containing protein n=1 Tax=Paracoccus yeei TaxID=147645 RepID=A0A2P1BUG6_9RHOB|nr:DUF1156 domain-containing protein [Paracoccus yeei]AVI58356.1 hypothetical protein A6J80_16220 [Paracoccus yeei]
MTQTYKKKLIEVALPLEAINAASAREKSIRHGHPSTLHLWWARRPLAACRAVLFAQLVDDPSAHEDRFPTTEAQEAERKRLFGIIEDLVKWENSTNEEVLERARAEIRRSCCGVLPPVYDPFSGGGSIPLEAQRLGLPAYGSDLNPVAVMIGKAMIEIPPKFKDMAPIHPGIKGRSFYRNAEGLAEDVKYYGDWMREKTWERIGHLYPQVDLPKEYGGGKATVIAWIWARTVASPDPALRGTHVPLISSYVLSSKAGKKNILAPVIDKGASTYSYEVKTGDFSKAEMEKAGLGTKAGKAQDFLCLLSGSPIPRDYIRDEGRSGRLGLRLIAIVAEGKGKRIYLPATGDMAEVATSVSSHLEVQEARQTFLSGSTPTRAMITGGVCSAYGLDEWGKLFIDRQILLFLTLGDLLNDVRTKVSSDASGEILDRPNANLASEGCGITSYAEAISIYLSFAINRSVDRGSSICTWDSSPKMEALRNTFARQALPMTWDFAEGNPFSKASGNFVGNVDWVAKAIERFSPSAFGSIKNADAQTVEMPSDVVISTDPPYYDNIGYADLSDFFYCWMRRSLRSVFPNAFGVLATPKSEELVATQFRHGSKEAADNFFLEGMRRAIKNMVTYSAPTFPAAIYYAFKQNEIDQEGISSTGWATFLQAVVEAGYAVVGTWPMRTEMANRMIASGTNALANSVVLVCRKKEASAEVITRAEFIRALKRELPPAIEKLTKANIAPADMPQSAIGPGMGVFSRYRAVLEPDDSAMSVKTALQLINTQLDEYLGGIEGDFDPDTRFAITWFEQNGMKAGDYGSADNLARARGISVESVKHAGIVESKAGSVRILARSELDPAWEPDQDAHPTVWECLQHLIRLHEDEGISFNTAAMLKKIGSRAEAVKDLAYCLYNICDGKRNDAKEATAYNGLIADWSELTKEAAGIHDVNVGTRQARMDI